MADAPPIEPAREPMADLDLACAEAWATSNVTVAETRTWRLAKWLQHREESDRHVRALVAEVKRLRRELAAGKV